MVDWKNILITPNASIMHTIEIIDKSGLRAALVVSKSNELMGMVTDGDIRRSILHNINLAQPIKQIMNCKPIVASSKDSRERMLAILDTHHIQHLPIVNEKNHLVGFETSDTLRSISHKNNLVIVMAGGIGKRLQPLTVDCPKPLLKIGSKPVLEVLLENFIKHGFQRFCFAVNYKSEMIKNYFNDGAKWGIKIDYLHEPKRLGTAGALGLLDQKPDSAFFVVNADVMTNIDFQSLLSYHNENKVAATLCIRQHEQEIPYGVVERDANSHHLVNIIEKPINQFFVNAGIYILEPQILHHLSANTHCDMPDLLLKCVNSGDKIATFPIREYWLDIGRHEDLQKAHHDYEKVFAC